MSLSDRIREQRKACGLSQEKVAEFVGVSRQAVAKWETGRSAPSTENLFRLAELFHTSVDLLLPSGDAPTSSSADLVRLLLEADEARRAALNSRRRRNLRSALLILAGYLLIYFLGRVIWVEHSDTTLVGWLFTAAPSRPGSYLYGWLLSRRMFWYAAAISVLPALFGAYRFSAVTLAAFVAGLPLGIILGPNPAGAAIGHTHYGWVIWVVIFLLSIPAGIILEHICGKRAKSTA